MIHSLGGKSIDWLALHREHVARLRQKYDEVFRRFADLDGIVIHSGKSIQKHSRDDQYWPTAPTPHFVHWTPYQETPALLIVRPAMPPELVIEKHTSFWEGTLPENPRWHRDSFTITHVDCLKEADVRGTCVYIGDQQVPFSRMEQQDGIWDPLIVALDQLRTIKSPYEIESMKVATRIALYGHQRLKDLFLSQDSISELDLHYEFLKSTEQTDFSVPYSDIVALGSNAAILHHVHYDAKKRSGDLSLLLDAGASCNGYASDITRTWVRGAGPSASKFAELLAGVDSVQQSLCKEFVVGTRYEDLHNKSHFLLAKVLCDIGLTSALPEDLVSSGATRCLFPHGLGHSLGIQVHDVGMKLIRPGEENPYLRNTSVIEAGNVVTIEPGIYFIGSLLTRLKALAISGTFNWPMVEQLRPFGGIRIEDNMLATADGPVNLTRA